MRDGAGVFGTAGVGDRWGDGLGGVGAGGGERRSQPGEDGENDGCGDGEQGAAGAETDAQQMRCRPGDHGAQESREQPEQSSLGQDEGEQASC